MSEVSNVVNEVVQAANQVDPNAPVVEVAEAAIKTISDPSVPVLVDDLILVHKLVSDVKSALAGKHASMNQLFWMLFHI